jgi:hypothetical protein
MSERETYLGDGLYASFDGYQFRLRAPRSEGDHLVYLEPEVYFSFKQYVEEIFAGLNKAKEASDDHAQG